MASQMCYANPEMFDDEPRNFDTAGMMQSLQLPELLGATKLTDFTHLEDDAWYFDDTHSSACCSNLTDEELKSSNIVNVKSGKGFLYGTNVSSDGGWRLFLTVSYNVSAQIIHEGNIESCKGVLSIRRKLGKYHPYSEDPYSSLSKKYGIDLKSDQFCDYFGGLELRDFPDQPSTQGN